MAYTPRTFRKDSRTEVATSHREETALRWDGWTPDDGLPYTPPPAFSPAQEVALRAAFVPVASPAQGQVIQANGHSYVTDTGHAANRHYLQRLATALGMGAPVRFGNSGYRTQSVAANALATGTVTTQRIVPSGKKIGWIDTGINDVDIFGNQAAAIAAHKHGLRAMIAAFRARVFVPATDASVVTSGAWATTAAQAIAPSGGTMAIKYATTSGASVTYTVTVAAGEEVTLLLLGNSAAGWTHSVAVDGGAAQTIQIGGQCITSTAGASLPNDYCFLPHRISGLSAGTHTIVVTNTTTGSINTQGYFISHAAPPPVFVAQILPIAATWASQAPPYNMGSDAALAAFQAATAAVVAEFASGVYLVDARDVWVPNSHTSLTDRVHPNDWGTDVLAADYAPTVDAAMRELGYPAGLYTL